MKWFTKRALLTSNDKMYPALSKVLVDFIDKLVFDGKVKLWYSSLKNNDGIPSFRVYIQIEDADEKYVQSQFKVLMKQNQSELGWTGQFADPNVPDSVPRLRECARGAQASLEDCFIRLE